MRSRTIWTAAVLLAAGFLGTTPAQGECVSEFFHSVVQNTARRNCWPAPFLYPARQAAREPFANMVANGWEVQNMLTDGHFDSGTGRLTPAGEAMVLWILDETPQQHRNIFVHRARTAQETAARIAAVEQFVTQSVTPNEYPPVLESRRSAEVYSAESYDAVGRKFQAALPEPKLTSSGQSGSSSSGSPH